MPISVRRRSVAELSDRDLVESGRVGSSWVERLTGARDAGAFVQWVHHHDWRPWRGAAGPSCALILVILGEGLGTVRSEMVGGSGDSSCQWPLEQYGEGGAHLAMLAE